MSVKVHTRQKALRDGFVGFFTGKPREFVYSKNPDEITARAWQMTGNSLRKAMDDYDGRK